MPAYGRHGTHGSPGMPSFRAIPWLPWAIPPMSSHWIPIRGNPRDLRATFLLRLSFHAITVAAVFACGGVMRGAGPLAQATSADDDIVKLGPVTVEAQRFGRTYYYAEVPGFELLSPFSAKDTQSYAQELQRQRALLGFFIPELALTRGDTPEAIFLDDHPPYRTSDRILEGRAYSIEEGELRLSLDAIRGVPDPSWLLPFGRTPSTISSTRAVAPDHIVFYTSIHGFDYARQSGRDNVVAADRGLTHIFPLAAVYEHRRPRWPSWIEDGLDAFGARFFSENTLEIFMFMKLSPPPAGLTIEEVFGPRVIAERGNISQVRLQAGYVFINWALAGDGNSSSISDSMRKDAFWKFASRACYEPVTEEMFVSYFGAEAWNAILRRWARSAVHQNPRIPLITYWPDQKPTFPDVQVHPATRAELVRIRSEYEWRIGREFAAAAPELAKQCFERAGRRLRKAYADGERDPRFLVVLALYEVDVGSPEKAREYIEEAAATKVVRPSVYFHLARFREAEELAKLTKSEGKLSLEQVRHVLEPLEIARSQRPALSEVYQAMTELWGKCAALPSHEDLLALEEGVKLFPRDLLLVSNVGLLHARAGEIATADIILAHALPFAPEGSDIQMRLRQLLAAVRASKAEKEKATMNASDERMSVPTSRRNEPDEKQNSLSDERSAKVPLVAVAAVDPAVTVPAAAVASQPLEEPVVLLPPFKVMAEWMEVQPQLKGSFVEFIRVLYVQKNSPAAIAGVQEGMRIVELQGIAVPGLAEDILWGQVKNLPPAETLTLKIRGLTQDREIVIAFSKRAKAATAATGSSVFAQQTPDANLNWPANATDAKAKEYLSDLYPRNAAALAPGSTVFARQAPVDNLNLPANATDAMARKYLSDIRRLANREEQRALAEAKARAKASGGSISYKIDPVFREDAAHLVGVAMGAHLGVVLESCVNTQDTHGEFFYAQVLGGAIYDPLHVYAPAQKEIVLKYLTKLPGLINIVARMQWFDGSETAVAAGWKIARKDEQDGMLTGASSRYARVAARCGVTDALIALARTVRNPNAGKRKQVSLLRRETAALMALGPSTSDDPIVLADVVLKNKDKLVFDPAKSVYVIKP
jgi:hypothetical protein